MDEVNVYKYLSGKATAEEEKQLFEWIKTSPENRIAFFELKAIWSSRLILNKTDLNTDFSLKQLYARMNERTIQERGFSYYAVLKYSIAAAILLAVLISIPFLIQKPAVDDKNAVCVYTNNSDDDSIKSFFLADGTNVWLGRKSTLTCPQVFDGETREVQLTGEAFFEVTKDPKHPFIVKTGENEIKVLGTSFSVYSRENDNTFETVLMNGSILLNNKKGEKIAVLRPGQQALYSIDSQSVEINEVDANALTSWRFGLISLSDVTISTVIRCIEETYNIHINMDTHSLKGRTYNFSFKRSKGPKEALNQLFYITGISAEVIP